MKKRAGNAPAALPRSDNRLSPKRGYGSLIKEIKRDRQLLMLLALPVLHILVFCYVPIYGITISFRDFVVGDPFFAVGADANWVGFSYFIQYFKSIFFQRTILNTLLINVYSLLFTFWIPIAFALLLNEITKSWYKRFVQTVSYLPYFVSTVIVVSLTLNILSADGALNNVLEALGMNRIDNLMYNLKYFRTVYIIQGTWQTFGWSSILYLSAISSIDQELYEAARIDGADRWKQAVHITLPGISPTVVIVLLLTLGGLFSANTEKLLLMQNPGNIDVSDVIGTYAYRIGILQGEYSYSTAIGLFVSAVNFVILVCANTFSKRITDNGLW